MSGQCATRFGKLDWRNDDESRRQRFVPAGDESPNVMVTGVVKVPAVMTQRFLEAQVGDEPLWVRLRDRSTHPLVLEAVDDVIMGWLEPDSEREAFAPPEIPAIMAEVPSGR